MLATDDGHRIRDHVRVVRREDLHGPLAFLHLESAELDPHAAFLRLVDLLGVRAGGGRDHEVGGRGVLLVGGPPGVDGVVVSGRYLYPERRLLGRGAGPGNRVIRSMAAVVTRDMLPPRSEETAPRGVFHD